MFKRKCKITFITHGATVHSLDGIISDSEKYPKLNEWGEEEIEKVCEYLEKRAVHYDKIYTSSSARCTQVLGLSMISYTSIFGLCLAFCMFNFIPKLSVSEKQPEHKEFFKTFKEIFSNTQMNLLMVVSMMKSLITNSFCILLPFLWKGMNYSPFYIGFALFLFVFAGAIASFLSPLVERKVGSKPIIYFSMWATFPMMIAFWLTYQNHPTISIIIFFIIGFTTMLAQPVTMVWAQETMPKYKSIVAGFINGFCWGIVALCVSVLGSVGEKYGIMNVLLFISIIPAISSYFVKYLNETKITSKS